MNLHGVFKSPSTIYFGSGQRAALPKIVGALGRRVFICSDERFFRDSKLSSIAEALSGHGLAIHVYDQTQPELPLDCILEAADAARAFVPDVIVAIGGGSCLDLGKLVATCLAHGDDLSGFYGELKVPGAVLPVIAVPTTAGTGSEVTPVAVLADPKRQLKVGISSPHLVPRIAICDPELTLTCPPRLTAICGADALTHAIEAFTAVRRPFDPDLPLRQVFIGKNSVSDSYAQMAIPALAKYLKRAVDNGEDLVAREQVMYGATTAGLAFGVAGTAAAHAIQYPIGAITKTAHGLGVAALIPYVMEYNFSAATTSLAQIARLLGSEETDEETLAEASIDIVSELLTMIGIPSSLQELGVPADRLQWIAEQALLSARLVNNNPRPLDAISVLRIAKAAFDGDRHRLRANRQRKP
jgi:alcohol dehydrogenase class IV